MLQKDFVHKKTYIIILIQFLYMSHNLISIRQGSSDLGFEEIVVHKWQT